MSINANQSNQAQFENAGSAEADTEAKEKSDPISSLFSFSGRFNRRQFWSVLAPYLLLQIPLNLTAVNTDDIKTMLDMEEAATVIYFIAVIPLARRVC